MVLQSGEYVVIFLEEIEAKLRPPRYVKILRVESKKRREAIFVFAYVLECQYYIRNIKHLYTNDMPCINIVI